MKFTKLGLLVFDAGDRNVRVFDSKTGALRGTVGREGSGPGEFSQSMWFLGSYERPALFDASARRMTPLDSLEGELVSQQLPRSVSWISACSADEETILGTVVPRGAMDIVWARHGQLVDSMASPWPELRTEHFLARQSIAQQLDDDSCILLTLYQSVFAVNDHLGLRFGRYIESAAQVSAEVSTLGEGREGVGRCLEALLRGQPQQARGETSS